MHAMYDVNEFCRLHGISRAFFYKLLKNGLGPKTVKLGTKTLITAEAAAQWRRELENRVSAADEAQGV